MLVDLISLSQYPLAAASLLSIFVLIRKGKDEQKKRKHTVELLLFVAVLILSQILKISFYFDGLDSVFVITVILAGLFSVTTSLNYRSAVAKALAYLGATVIAFAILFFGLIISFFAKPLLQSTESLAGSNQIAKTYKLGGATAACDYEIKRNVFRILIFEKEVKSETKLLTHSSRCTKN